MILAQSFLFRLWDFQSILSANVPVHYASLLVVVSHVCCSCLHLTLDYYLLDTLQNIFAQPAPEVLSGVLEPNAVDLIPALKQP